MTEKLELELVDRRQAWKDIQDRLYPFLAGRLNGETKWLLTLSRRKRTNPQNSKMWAMLYEISTQVKWNNEKLLPEEWKDLFTAALKKQKIVHGIDGGIVVLGARTSQMTTQEISDLIELIYAFGVEKSVVFKDGYES